MALPSVGAEASGADFLVGDRRWCPPRPLDGPRPFSCSAAGSCAVRGRPAHRSFPKLMRSEA